MFELKTEVKDKHLIEIKRKLGSKSLLKLIDNYKEKILEKHKEIKSKGEEKLDEYNSNSIKDINDREKLIEHISLKHMKDDLITNLSELNKHINQKKANIFINYSRSNKYNNFFSVLKTIIESKKMDIKKTKYILFNLYPATIAHYLRKRSTDEVDEYIKNIIDNLKKINKYKLNQILTTIRFDSIIDNLFLKQL